MARPKLKPGEEKVGVKFVMLRSEHEVLMAQSEKSGIAVAPYLRKAIKLFIADPVKAIKRVSVER